MERIFTYILAFTALSRICFSQATEKIRILNGCGVSKYIDPDIIVECGPPTERNKALIRSMVYSTGQKNLNVFIGSSKSPNVEFAISGMKEDGTVCVIINEADLENEKYDNYSRFSLLAHELGHINNGHFNTPAPLTRKSELSADYYAGFWTSKDNFPDINKVYKPFSILQEDAIHPPFSERKESITSGWDDGKKPFEIPSQLIKAELKDILKSYIDLIMFTTPAIKKNFFGKVSLWHKITLSIASNALILPHDSLYSKIAYVSYAFHPYSFKQPFVTLNSSYRSTGFEYLLTVWGEFPITAIITFIDGSALSITKKFEFPDFHLSK